MSTKPKLQSYDVRVHGKISVVGYFNSELENRDELIAAIMVKHHVEKEDVHFRD
ncbi:MAG: hypothetical protein WB680_22555 [Candidatus Acidiferrales bacterium]